jgi:hypothetical protein
LTGFYPDQNVPKIESLTQLRKLRKACYRLSYKDKDGVVQVFDAHSFKPGHPKPKFGYRENSVSQQKGLLVKYAKREVLPDTVKGLCLFCGKIVLSSKPGRVRVHARCYGEHWGNKLRRGLPTEQQKPGGQVTIELLRRRWAWTIRNKLGDESLGDLVDQFGVPRSTIETGIKFIMDHLAETDLVPRNLRATVILLQAANIA